MTQQEIITHDYVNLVNAKAHIEALRFIDARAENARLEALFHVQESIRWLDSVRVRMVISSMQNPDYEQIALKILA